MTELPTSRLARRCIGRVEIDHEHLMVDLHPCLTIASKLSAAGFPLNLGMMGPELWGNDKWKWAKFREAASQVGVSWWAWHEDMESRSIIFEWGDEVNE